VCGRREAGALAFDVLLVMVEYEGQKNPVLLQELYPPGIQGNMVFRGSCGGKILKGKQKDRESI
jgi:hypothetical protein